MLLAKESPWRRCRMKSSARESAMHFPVIGEQQQITLTKEERR